MTYKVIWTPSAEVKLIQLWSDALDKKAMTQAANQLEVDLGRDPLSVGESRIGRRRIAMYPPLYALFDVIADRQCVVVHSIWARKQR